MANYYDRLLNRIICITDLSDPTIQDIVHFAVAKYNEDLPPLSFSIYSIYTTPKS